jgi:hypothetical protein
MALFESPKTPEKVKAALATLKPAPRITLSVIESYCRRAGRVPATAEALVKILKEMSA